MNVGRKPDPDTDPTELPCYLCWLDAGNKPTMDDTKPPKRRVVYLLDPPANAADPTQAYELECGHVTI